jgi:hypothetical protein
LHAIHRDRETRPDRVSDFREAFESGDIQMPMLLNKYELEKLADLGTDNLTNYIKSGRGALRAGAVSHRIPGPRADFIYPPSQWQRLHSGGPSCRRDDGCPCSWLVKTGQVMISV